jgi:hypothetical protein
MKGVTSKNAFGQNGGRSGPAGTENIVTSGDSSYESYTTTFERGAGTAEAAVSNFETLSNSQSVLTNNDLDKNDQITGHNLLRDMQSEKENLNPTQRKISEFLYRGNRFSLHSSDTDSPRTFTRDGSLTSAVGERKTGMLLDKQGLGVYKKDAKYASVKDLRQRAEKILLAQTKNDGSGYTDSDSMRFRSGNNTAELIYDEEGNAIASSRSHGAQFSHEHNFQDSLSNASDASAYFIEFIKSTLFLVPVIEATSSAVVLLDDLDRESSAHGMRKGESRSSGKWAKYFGIPDKSTGYSPFAVRLVKGIASFIGLTYDPGSVQGTLGGAINLSLDILGWASQVALTFAADSGYYATAFRMLNRDINTLIEKEIEGNDSVIEMLLELTSSISWNFLMTMIELGTIEEDRSFAQVRSEYESTATSYPKLGRENRSLVTTWRSSAMPAMMLLNSKLRNASIAFNTPLNGIDEIIKSDIKAPVGASGIRLTLKEENLPRLESADVVEIERQLESEYCPFYMQDLRTNEIISFHAFLNDLKDSYAVNYAETGGYGRIDKVKIYQDTTRSISMSWVMVATSEKDFDMMWLTMNKLITMIYPQFSMGKSMQANDKKFVMPFSQIPTASPMIRLRVGDVIKSNYSKFNLARLFGLSEVKVENNTSDTNEPSYFGNLAKDEERIKDKQKELTDRWNNESFQRRFGGGISNQEIEDTSIGFDPRNDDWNRAVLKKVPEIYERPVVLAAKGTVVKIISRDISTSGLIEYTALATLEDGSTTEIFFVKQEDLEPVPPDFRQQAEKLVSPALERPLENEISEFFKSSNNAVVRSFESSMGKGLAGFITSFDMDWEDAMWDMGPGRKAPTLIKVSISFAPIHDIIPGLDNNGMMRAVNYQVGDYSRALHGANDE